MNKSRQSANLVSKNNIFSSIIHSRVGIGTTIPQYTFDIVGNINFSGSLNQNGSTFIPSSVAANSVGLGTATVGDYVKDITGTTNQITVTSGTGEGSSPTLSVPNQFTAPQDVTITRDLQVNRNLNVNGNITIGGTSTTLFTTELNVYDPDIVLGFRTDAFGNDISTDNTANHGGIAIASTEGTPLISLFDVGIGETNAATYKKFMWFKSGTFSGLGTDAWISNYAIGIGSTQVPNGVRLSAGGMQVTSNTVSSPQLNITGISTFTNGPLLVGSGTSTGTTSQRLQVTGGGYVSGNLGIGATNPQYALDVSGDINFTGTFRQNGSTFVASRWTSGIGDDIYRLNGNVLVGTSSSTGTASQKLQVNGGAYFNGLVGIGTTNPTVALQLSPDARISNLNANTSLSSTAGVAATVAQFYHLNGNASYLRIKATRNTSGSDWTTASTKLLQVIDVTEQGYIEFNPNGANYGLAFGQGSNEYMRILNGGNVGVGITNPSHKLSVVGDINFTGSLYKNGAPLTSGTSVGRVYFSVNS